MKVLVFWLLSFLSPCWAWSSSSSSSRVSSGATTRRDAFLQGLVSAATATLVASSSIVVVSSSTPGRALALEEKQVGISNEELGKIITRDIQENQFMVGADITRSVYDESATFTDEIDTYEMDQWIKGTKRLFVADKSRVDLVPDSMQVTDAQVTFRFTEDLTFNIPLLLPKVYLSGTVELKRDPKTGLITSYQEKWDQSINTVLTSAKLGGK